MEKETDRLRKFGELKCSDEIATKLKEISFRTIDEKLKYQKEIESIRKKYQKKISPLLYQKIPIKLFDDWDRSQLGNIQQTDLIEHCSQSAREEYGNTILFRYTQKKGLGFSRSRPNKKMTIVLLSRKTGPMSKSMLAI